MCNGVKEEHGVDGGRPPRETRANESTSRTEPGTQHPGAQSVYPAARQRGLRLAGVCPSVLSAGTTALQDPTQA
ncbi:hypothetical protein PC123_g24710 [Phytophthora cactorum]|nr:hypothetical protein PC123_g24710 [Phytophthora cactorum]